MVSVPCDNCEASLDKYPSQVNDTNFCDSDCYAEYREDALTGEDNPNHRGATSEYECEWCEGTFERPDAWVDDDRQPRFCSRPCKASAERMERAGVSVGLDSDGYLMVQTGNERVGLHRLLAVAVYGVEEVVEHDHVHHPVPVPWLNVQTNVLPVDRETHRHLHNRRKA